MRDHPIEDFVEEILAVLDTNADGDWSLENAETNVASLLADGTLNQEKAE